MNLGENINNIEVLRDFNGWNWNTQSSEISDTIINLIYQNLILLLGIHFLKQWVHTEEMKDYLQLAIQELENKYGKIYTNYIVECLYPLCIIFGTEKNSKERQMLLEEKQEVEKELQKMADRTKLLNEVSKNKKQTLEKIKEIDTIIHDKKLLEEEFKRRNENLPEYNRIFSIAHLVEILARQRKKLLNKMEEENKILEPSYFVKKKTELEQQLALLKNADWQEEKEDKKMEYVMELQKAFLKCFKTNVEKVEKKEEMIRCIYELRYYNFIPITAQKKIQEDKALKRVREQLQRDIINKAIALKGITPVFKDEKLNYLVIKSIFETNIINLENINIELFFDNGIKINWYDGDILEKQIQIKEGNAKDILIKKNKKVKLLLA